MRRAKADPGAAPETGDVAAGHAAQEPAADQAEVERLLQTLGQLRLSLAADLSAAAGALEAERADIASEMLAGAQADLRNARRLTAGKPSPLRHPPPVPVGAGVGGPGSASSNETAGLMPTCAADDAQADQSAVAARLQSLRQLRPTGWKGKLLVGAMALAAAVTVVPQVTSAGGPSTKEPATAASAAPNLHLVSAEFAAFRRTVQSAHPSPAAVLAAGQRWQQALARHLPDAASNVSAAKSVVTLLREQQALLRTSAGKHNSPAMRAATFALGASADALFARLRSLADGAVLAVLPRALGGLPVLPSGPSGTQPKPRSQQSTGGTLPSSPTTGTSTLPSAPATTGSSGSAPAGSNGQTTPAPTGPTLPLPTLPNPIPSVLNPLTGILPGTGSTASGATNPLSQAVTGTVSGALGALDGLVGG